MVERDQIRPLARSSDQNIVIISDDEDTSSTTPAAPPQHKWLLRKKRSLIRCCGCVAALLLIQAVVLIILIFTVFKVREPIISINGVSVDRLDLGTAIPFPRPGSNMTITADVSVKNPNYASFKYSNTTTSLYYHGAVVGDARGPPGHARARRTMRMNLTVDIITDRILSSPMLGSDLSSGLLNMNSFTRVGGRVKMLNIITRHVVVKMNCTIVVNITTQAIHEQNCKRKVKL